MASMTCFKFWVKSSSFSIKQSGGGGGVVDLNLI